MPTNGLRRSVFALPFGMFKHHRVLQRRIRLQVDIELTLGLACCGCSSPSAVYIIDCCEDPILPSGGGTAPGGAVRGGRAPGLGSTVC